MTTAGDFLREICRTPEEVAPRLLYADWLDEVGDAVRSAFVRTQVWLADPKRVCPYDAPSGFAVNCTCQVCGMRRREKELFDRLGANPFAWLPGLSTVTLRPPLDGGLPCGLVRRGFVEAVRLPAASWLAHADAILAAAPVLGVALTTWPEVEVTRPADSPPGKRVRLKGRRQEHPPYIYVGRMLEVEWPRIRFTLPGPEVAVR